MIKWLIVGAMLSTLVACDLPERDITLGWNSNVVLQEEMNKRGFIARGNTVFMNGVPIFDFVSCTRCDSTVFLGPPALEYDVLQQFNRALDESLVAEKEWFARATGLIRPPVLEPAIATE